MKYSIFASAILATLIPAAASAQTEIQWWHAFTGRLAELLDQHVADFNASQSDYVVVATPKGNYSEALNAGIAAFRAGEQPHILQVFEVGTATMMGARGAIKPVYEVLEESGLPFDPASYLPAVTGYYTTVEGQMLSFPYNSSTPVMYVNRTLFEEAGVDPDTDLTTWEQVDEVLTQLQDGGLDCPFTTTWQSWVHLETLSARHDQPFATQENGFAGFDAELVFNDALQVAHIEKMAEWARDGKFVYAGRRSEPGASFRAGDCAIMTESSAGYAGVKAEADFEFDIHQLPYWGDAEGAPLNSIIGGASLWVMAGHDDAEYQGVAAFLSYLSSPEVQAKWHQDTGYLPVTQAAYDLTREQGFYEANPGTNIAVEQMSATEPTANSKGIRLGNFDQIRTIIDEELEAVWSGDKSAQDALDTAAARGNELLRRFEQANR